MRVLMTQKSCAVGMRNAILRNYLKEIDGGIELPFARFEMSSLFLYNPGNLKIA